MQEDQTLKSRVYRICPETPLSSIDRGPDGAFYFETGISAPRDDRDVKSIFKEIKTTRR